jgi:lipoyl(octanoyl) transferase
MRLTEMDSRQEPAPRLEVRWFEGLQDYSQIHQQMQQFNADRAVDAADELWLLQHHPVFTQGVNGQAEHLLDAGDIPVLQSDRGGQITYHGPGQLICYLLLDIRRRGIGVKGLVYTIEQALIDCLGHYGVAAERRCGAPGIYVADAKIAALGLRVRRGCSYHGLSLNVDMDLSPFNRINPCGYAGLAVTQLADQIEDAAPSLDQVGGLLIEALDRQLAS